MCFAALVSAVVLHTYSIFLQRFISIRYSFLFELAMVAGQLLFQSLMIWRSSFQTKFDYWFHLLTVSLLGSLLLLLLIGFSRLFAIHAYAALIYFFCVVIFMFLEHKRRIARLQLPAYLSYTWLLYRVLILIFIL